MSQPAAREPSPPPPAPMATDEADVAAEEQQPQKLDDLAAEHGEHHADGEQPPPEQEQAGGDKAAQPAQQQQQHDDDGLGNVLAGLNHEQLASIMFAAQRSSDDFANAPAAASSGEASAAGAAAAAPAPYDSPSRLGVAASALTSFASGFKNAEGGERQDGGEAVGAEGEAEDATAAYVEEDKGDEGREGEAIAAMERLAEGAEDAERLPFQHGENGTPVDVQAQEAQMDVGDLSMGTTPGKKGKKNNGPEAERVRKDNHKEVERRRREQISLGIAELSQIVPGCDPKSTNKSAIVGSAVRYIQELRNNEQSNIEKWTLEKLLMDQAMNDLQAQLEATRRENERFREQLGLPPAPEPEPEPEQQEQHEGQHDGGEQDEAPPEEYYTHEQHEAAQHAAEAQHMEASGSRGGEEQEPEEPAPLEHGHEHDEQQHEQQQPHEVHEADAPGEDDTQLEAQQPHDGAADSIREAAEEVALAAADESAAHAAVAVAEAGAPASDGAGKVRTHDEMQGLEPLQAVGAAAREQLQKRPRVQ